MQLKGEEKRNPFYLGFSCDHYTFYQCLILINYLDFGGEGEDD